MTVEVSIKFTSGEFSYEKRRETVSCVPVANKGIGDDFEISSYYYVDGKGKVKVDDSGSVYFKLTSLTIKQMLDCPSGNSWNFSGLYVSRDSFNMVQNGSDYTISGNNKVLVCDKATGGIDNGSGQNVLSQLSSPSLTDYKKIADDINDLDSNTSHTELYLYIGGVVDIPGGATSGFDINAKQITIGGEGIPPISDLFDYYPWARQTTNTNTTWYSLNRTGGYLKRYDGLWKDVKNSTGSTGNKGFRHNNTTFVKSPKHGEGA